MSGFTPAYISGLLTTEAPKWATVSLHTADPGTTGANEATGGTPAYARKPATFTVAGLVATANEVTWDAPAGTYSHFGVWKSDGTFVCGNPLLALNTTTPTPQTLSSQGQVKNTPKITGSSV